MDRVQSSRVEQRPCSIWVRSIRVQNGRCSIRFNRVRVELRSCSVRCSFGSTRLDSIEFTFGNLEFVNAFCTSNTIQQWLWCLTITVPQSHSLNTGSSSYPVICRTTVIASLHYRLWHCTLASPSPVIVWIMDDPHRYALMSTIRFDSIPMLSIRSLEIIDRIEIEVIKIKIELRLCKGW